MPYLFFLSGFTSLCFQVLWLRGFSLILGSTIYAMACVVTAFLLGLAVGSFQAAWIIRRYPKTQSRGLLLYAVAEALIGLTGLGVTFSLFLYADPALRFLPNALAAHFLFASVVLLVPTSLMGMTLPFLALALPDQKQLPKLYGINTVGAACGSLASSFFFIYTFGCLTSAALICAMDWIIFAGAILLWKRSESTTTAYVPAEHTGSATRVVLALGAASGFIVLSCEIAWHRYLSLLLGNRIYVSSITLFLILYALGFAARLTPRLVERYPPRSIVIAAASLAVLSLSLGFLVEGPALLSVLQRGIWYKVAAAGFIVFSIIIPATASGLLFPVALVLGGRGEGKDGSWLGVAYGVNTLASIAGSLFAGYWLMDRVGTNGIVLMASFLLLALASYFAFAQRSSPRLRARAAAAALFFAVSTPSALQKPHLVPPEQTLLVEEDAHGIFTVAREAGGKLRVLQNNTDLVFLYGDDLTQFVQETQAYFPLAYAKHTAKLLNIGVGYGITAGAMARFPGVGTIDAVEIVPAMFTHADLFAEKNYRYFENPIVTKRIADGRQFLAASEGGYDVISINVTDPYLPGSSSLYSDEFYALAKRKLTPGGILCQHLFGPDVATLYHGVRDHFAYVKIMPAYRNGITLIASTEPLVAHGRAFLTQALFARLPFADAGEFFHLIDEGDQIAAALDSKRARFVDSDAHPTLEFQRLGGLSGFLMSNH